MILYPFGQTQITWRRQNDQDVAVLRKVSTTDGRTSFLVAPKRYVAPLLPEARTVRPIGGECVEAVGDRQDSAPSGIAVPSIPLRYPLPSNSRDDTYDWQDHRSKRELQQHFHAEVDMLLHFVELRVGESAGFVQDVRGNCQFPMSWNSAASSMPAMKDSSVMPSARADLLCTLEHAPDAGAWCRRTPWRRQR